MYDFYLNSWREYATILYDLNACFNTPEGIKCMYTYTHLHVSAFIPEQLLKNLESDQKPLTIYSNDGPTFLQNDQIEK